VPLRTIEEGTDEKAITPQTGSAVQITEEKPQSQDSGRDQPRKVEDNNHEDEDNETLAQKCKRNAAIEPHLISTHS